MPAHLYRGDTDAAMAACHAMLADADTPPRLRVLAVSMWALAEGLLGRYDEGQAILDTHAEVLAAADVGGFVSYVRAEVAAGTDPEAALRFLDDAIAESGEARALACVEADPRAPVVLGPGPRREVEAAIHTSSLTTG